MKKAYIKRILFLLFGVGLVLLLRYLDVGRYITLASVRDNATRLQDFVAHHYILALISYIIAYIFVAALALPFAAVMTITGGFLFGTVIGAGATNVGATIGCTAAFLFVRYVLGDMMQERYQVRLATFKKELDLYGHWYLLSIRFILVFPLLVGNILAGLANVSVVTFIWTTSLGIIPGSLIYSFAGQQIRTLRSVRDVLSYNVILAIGLLALLSFTPFIIRYIRSMRRYI